MVAPIPTLNFNPVALVDDGSCIYDDGECTEYEHIDLSWAYNSNFDPESVVVRLVNENAFYEFDGSIVEDVLPGCYTLTVLDLSCDGPSVNPIDECFDLIGDHLDYECYDDLLDQFDGATLILEGMEYEAGCFLPAVYEVVIGSGCTGCTDPLACNYSLGATSDDGSCIASGCTDSMLATSPPTPHVTMVVATTVVVQALAVAMKGPSGIQISSNAL